MAVDADSRLTAGGYEHRDICGELLAGPESGSIISGLWDPHFTGQVALLADRIAFGERQRLGIHNISRSWMRQMIGSVTMTTLTRYSAQRRNVIDTVKRIGNDPGAARMTEQALGRDGTIEVRFAIVFITRRHIPEPAVCIIAHGELIKIALRGKTIAAAHTSRADEEVEGLAMGFRFEKQTIIGLHNPVAGSGVGMEKTARRLIRRLHRTARVGHWGLRITRDYVCMARAANNHRQNREKHRETL